MINHDLLILGVTAWAVYLLVLGTHALRRYFGLAPFYALLGGLTAIMSWVTDAGVYMQAGGITFMVGSTVFYTSLLLGVFVVYVFDGPKETRTAIMTVAGISVLTPLIAALLHFQMQFPGLSPLGGVPVPGLRINIASVLVTTIDLVFLAVMWEILGSPRIRAGIPARSFLTLLGVMWLDVVLFSTGAFLGDPGYLSIMEGTLYSRLIIALFAMPVLYAYLHWQSRLKGCSIENRPVLAVLNEVAAVRENLQQARLEIERRKEAEDALHRSEMRYRRLAEQTGQILEAERRQLADELHDHIGQLLSAVKIDLIQCEKDARDNPDAAGRIGRIQRLLEDGILRTHLLCRQLRPGSLDDISLRSALREFAEEWSEYTGIPCSFAAEGFAEPGTDQRTALFRMLQEVLSNTARHAKATQVEILLYGDRSHVGLRVSDDGCGIPKNAEKKSASFGLMRVRAGVEAVGGVLEIKTRSPRGTVIEGQIPV
jgi:signal transduction histidine kinase